jgi:multiple sugar transport system permease protein
MTFTLTTRASRSAARGRPGSRRSLTPYLLVGPAVLLLLVFGILPILVAAAVSLTDLDIGGLGHPETIRFIGIQNYQTLFADPAFWGSLANTAFFVLIGVPTIVGLSLLIAIGLNHSNSRFFRALRSFYFLPAITAIVAISLIWGYLYNSQFGLINYVLGLVGLGPVPWLSDPLVARFSVAGVAIWRATGLNIIIFLAALQAVPREYREAAALDGAGAWRTTVSIVIPLLRFAILFVTVTTLISWMQFFDEPFVLLKWPANESMSASLYIYFQGFRFNEFGFASAASLVLLAIILVVTAVQLRVRRSSDD